MCECVCVCVKRKASQSRKMASMDRMSHRHWPVRGWAAQVMGRKDAETESGEERPAHAKVDFNGDKK